MASCKIRATHSLWAEGLWQVLVVEYKLRGRPVGSEWRRLLRTKMVGIADLFSL